MKDSFLIRQPPLCATAPVQSRLGVRAMAGTKATEEVCQMPFAYLWGGNGTVYSGLWQVPKREPGGELAHEPAPEELSLHVHLLVFNPNISAQKPFNLFKVTK